MSSGRRPPRIWLLGGRPGRDCEIRPSEHSVERHWFRYSVELGAARQHERHPTVGHPLDGLLAREDLTCLGLIGDPRGDVDRTAVNVAIAEDDRPGLDPDVRGRQPGGRGAFTHLERCRERGAHILEVEKAAIAQPSDRSAAMRACYVVHKRRERGRQPGRILVALLLGEAGEPGQVNEADGGCRLRTL
jgi:hypothetical protein